MIGMMIDDKSKWVEVVVGGSDKWLKQTSRSHRGEVSSSYLRIYLISGLIVISADGTPYPRMGLNSTPHQVYAIPGSSD